MVAWLGTRSATRQNEGRLSNSGRLHGRCEPCFFLTENQFSRKTYFYTIASRVRRVEGATRRAGPPQDGEEAPFSAGRGTQRSLAGELQLRPLGQVTQSEHEPLKCIPIIKG